MAVRGMDAPDKPIRRGFDNKHFNVESFVRLIFGKNLRPAI